MRSYLLFLFAVAFAVVCCGAKAQAEVDLRLAGVGQVISSSPYAGVGTTSQAVPLIVWDQGPFHVKGVELGYELFDNEQLELTVISAPRFMGFSSDDSDSLKGMEDAEGSLDVGLRVGLQLPWDQVELGLKLAGDALSRHDGFEADLGLSTEVKGSIWRMVPSAGVRFQSADMMDYYYGVSSGEVRGDRSAYEPSGALNYYANVMFNVGIHRDWVVVTRCGVEFLSDEISESPIVSRDVLAVGVVGLARRF